MLTLPISNAEVERTFSASPYFKSARRSTMKNELLENILYCKFGSEWLNTSLSSFEAPEELLIQCLKLLREDYN